MIERWPWFIPGYTPIVNLGLYAGRVYESAEVVEENG